jgi:hypothetical protein
MFRKLITALAGLSLIACTAMRPLPPGDGGQWRGQLQVGDEVRVNAANGKTYELKLVTVDEQKIVGRGDGKKVTIRYEQIRDLAVRRDDDRETTRAVGSGLSTAWEVFVGYVSASVGH